MSRPAPTHSVATRDPITVLQGDTIQLAARSRRSQLLKEQYSVVCSADCGAGPVLGPDRRPDCCVAVGGRFDEHERQDNMCSQTAMLSRFARWAISWMDPRAPTMIETPTSHADRLRYGVDDMAPYSTMYGVPTDKVRPPHWPDAQG